MTVPFGMAQMSLPQTLTIFAVHMQTKTKPAQKKTLKKTTTHAVKLTLSAHQAKVGVKTPPNARVSTKSHQDILVRWGVVAQQGWRSYMEDAVCVYQQGFQRNGLMLFGIFDGHGGSKTSRYLSHQLCKDLWTLFQQHRDPTEHQLQQLFMHLDQRLFDNSAHFICGSTAAVVILDTQQHRLWVCTVGDSRILVTQTNHDTGEHVPLFVSTDHTPAHPLEQKRIFNVLNEDTNIEMRNGRIIRKAQSSLNLSRAFGDVCFKQVGSDTAVTR